jgi:hypothetical protein
VRGVPKKRRKEEQRRAKGLHKAQGWAVQGFLIGAFATNDDWRAQGV